MSTFVRDLRAGVRVLARNRGVTLIALACLALGIGANTAIFSVINAVLLRPLPFAEPERLVSIQDTHGSPGEAVEVYNVSPPNFVAWRDRSESFAGVAALYQRSFNLVGADGQAVRVPGGSISAGLLSLLGVQPILGRAILPEEDVPGSPARVVLISNGLWQRRFGGDRAVVGSTLQLDGEAYRVIGVMPAGFRFPEGIETPQGADLWEPLGLDPDKEPNRNWHNLFVVARLAPGVSIEQARAEVAGVAGRMAAEHPDTNTGWGAQLDPLDERLVGDVGAVLYALLAAVAFVLAMACVNVGSLLLSRTVRRSGEMAVRAAMGASRRRLVRQLLTESLVLAVAGGVLGVVLARVSFPWIAALSPVDIPRLDGVGLDLRVLGFAFLVSVLTGVLFGVVPALHGTRANLYPLLRQGGGRLLGAIAGRRLQGAVVVAQVALVVVLLVGAGLMVESLERLERVDPGYDATNVLTVQIWLSEAQYPEIYQRAAFFRDAVRQIDQVPGVVSTGGSTTLPVADVPTKASFVIEGRQTDRPGEVFLTNHRRVQPGYLETLHVPLIEGRYLNDSDDADAPGVVVISKAMAEHFWPGENALGKRVKRGWRSPEELPWLTVVGVVDDVLDNGLDNPPEPTWYLPDTQHDTEYMNLVIRTEGDPMALAPAIRAAIREVDPEQPIYRVATLQSLVGASVAKRRFGAVLLAVFAAVGVLLAAIGIYGVMSYTVGERSREISLRLALGARPGTVLRSMLARGMALTVGGLAVGLVATLLLVRLFSGLLYGVSPTDPSVLGGMSVLFVLIALVATYLPARRVTRVDPVVALRSE